MSEYQTGLVFRQLALVPFPDSSYLGLCLKSDSVYSYKSIRVTFGLNDQKVVYNLNSLPLGFQHSLDFEC